MTQYRVALWAFLGLFAASISLAGCNTVRGAGQDVEAAGAGVAGTAEDTQQELRRRAN
jgi:predicted small secreted protein